MQCPRLLCTQRSDQRSKPSSGRAGSVERACAKHSDSGVMVYSPMEDAGLPARFTNMTDYFLCPPFVTLHFLIFIYFGPVFTEKNFPDSRQLYIWGFKCIEINVTEPDGILHWSLSLSSMNTSKRKHRYPLSRCRQ